MAIPDFNKLGYLPQVFTSLVGKSLCDGLQLILNGKN
jgi:hypothetical protein